MQQIFIMYKYKQMYILKKWYVYILNIFIYNIKYKNLNIEMYIQVSIFKIYTVCVYIYIYITYKSIHLVNFSFV